MTNRFNKGFTVRENDKIHKLYVYGFDVKGVIYYDTIFTDLAYKNFDMFKVIEDKYTLDSVTEAKMDRFFSRIKKAFELKHPNTLVAFSYPTQYRPSFNKKKPNGIIMIQLTKFYPNTEMTPKLFLESGVTECNVELMNEIYQMISDKLEGTL